MARQKFSFLDIAAAARIPDRSTPTRPGHSQGFDWSPATGELAELLGAPETILARWGTLSKEVRNDLYLRLGDDLLRLLGAKYPARYCPHVPLPTQLQFLRDTRDDVLYGGGVAGGKTVAALMYALEGVDVPGYSCLLLRREAVNLTQPGCLEPISHDWLGGTDARWRDGTEWVFPSGAVIRFGHMQHDTKRFSYGSASYHRVVFEELGEFPTEIPYTFMFSRVGRTALPPKPDGRVVTPGVRATCNPIGPGLDWIRSRYVRPPEGTEIPTTRGFIPSLLTDNEFADSETYLRMMSNLDAVTRARLEGGDWDVKPAGLVWPDLDSCVGDWPLPEKAEVVAGLDWGFKDPAATVIGLWEPKAVGGKHGILTITEVWKKSGILPEGHKAATRALMANYGALRFARAFGDPSRPDNITLFNAGEKDGETLIPGLNITPAFNDIKPGCEAVNRIIGRGCLRITKRAAKELLAENNGYMWGKDEMPVAALGDHALDAFRYLVSGLTLVSEPMAVTFGPERTDPRMAPGARRVGRNQGPMGPMGPGRFR